MDITEILQFVISGIPNFAGFMIALIFLNRQNQRLTDIIEKHLDDDDDDN